MKKYIFFLGVLFWVCSFATPEELDDTFQTFNPDGVTNANIAANNIVQIAVPTPDGKILIGGDFTTYKGATVNRLARINRDGTLDTSFAIQAVSATGIGLDAGTVNAIAIVPEGTADNYSIIIGGTFTKVRNKPQNRLAKIDCITTSGTQMCSLDLDFVLADTLDGATGGSVNVIGFVPGSTANNYSMILGGSFTKIKKITQNRLSRIDCVTVSGNQTCSVNTNLVPAATNAGPANAVNAIAFAPGSTLSDFDLFLGGAFMSYAGFSQRGVAKISCTTQSGNQTCPLVTNFFGTGTTNGINAGVVNALVIFPGGTPDNYSFLIGGTFTKFNNIVQNRLTRVLSDGTVDANFVGTDATDGANGAIETIAIYDNGVTLLGGAFASYASVPRNRLVQLSESGELDPYFSNVLPVGPDNIVQKIVIEQDGKIIVTGQFAKYSDLTTGRIVRLRGMTSALSPAGCPAGTTFCGFDNSCVADMSQCASCPADFTHRSSSLSPADFVPSVLPAQSVWSNLPDMTIARTAHDVVAVNNKIYVFGGQESNTVNTEIFDPITNTWSQPAAARYPVGTSAAGIMVAAVGEKIYTFHGKNTYEYNTSTQTWTQKASNTISRTHGSAVNVDGKIYVIGGLNSYKNQIYDPVRNTWSNAADIPKTGFASYGFSYTQAAALGGKIYLIGGVSMDTFQYYDPCLNRWIALPDLTDFPTSNQYSSHSTVVVNGEIYVSGGSLARGNGTPVEVIHKKYNPTTRQWTTLANLPSPLMHNKGAVIDGKIYVIGGASNTTANTPSKKAYVYNASDNILTDESISACNCTPSCGEGKYYSLVDNLCKPAQQLTVVSQCNKNGICEIGESCDCFDCTNGGLDDQDSCGISQGAQMYCSRDTSFQMPGAPAQSMTYTDPRLFLQETNSTTFSYEHILGPQQATLRLLGPEYSFGPNAPTIRGYDVSKTYGNDRIHFSRRQLAVPGSINKLPANSYYLKNVSLGFNTEKFDFTFDKDIQAFGIEMYEPIGDTSITGCNAVCVQSTFKFLLYDDGVLVDDTITFSPPDNQDTFFGFWSPEKFDKIEVREITGTADNEFFGRIYYQDRSAGEQQCRIEKKIAHLFTNSNGTYTWFAPYTPREVINPFDPSQKVYVYKRERNIKWNADRVRANPQLAWDSAEDVTNRPVGSSNAPYDLIDANITNTTRANYLFGTGSRVHMALFGRLRTDGTLQTYFNDTSGGAPAFTRGSPYIAGATTNPQMMVQFADGGNSPNCADGYVCFDNRAVVGVYDIQVCEKTDAEICAVGACCPVGKKWDCDTNACILDTLTCPAGQIKKPAPGSALCLLRARVITPSQVDYLIQGFDGMDGSCSVTYNPLLGPSSGVLSVEENERQFQPGSTSVVLTPSSLNNSFSCPAGMVEGVCQTTNSEEGGVVGDMLCGCYPNPTVTMKVNITEFQNLTQTVTLGDGNKIQNNVAFELYNNGQPVVDPSFPTGNTKDIGIRRGPGTVEFFGYDRVNNAQPASIKGRITIEGAKISTINAITRSNETLDLEEGNNDYVRRIDDYTLEFSHYFFEPGDKWSLSYELPEPILSQPEYACVIQGCGEGQYWCSTEAVCKNGNEPCGIVTCNNDAVCDLEESCDCADCNDQIDHCGLNTNGQQLFCSKDSATESLGCPDGFILDANDVCIPSSTPVSGSFQRFDAQSSFASAHTGMTTIGYDTIALTSGRLPTFLYTFPGTGVSIRPNDSAYKTNKLLVSDLSNVLPGKEIYVTGKEHFEINFLPAVNAFGFDFNESTSCRAGFCPVTSVPSIFTIRFYDGDKKLQEYTFEPQDNVASFFGAASKRPFDRVSIQEVTGTVDDEALGKMYFQRFTDSLCQAYTPTQVLYTPNVDPRQQNWSNINGIGTPQIDAGKLVWQVNDAGTSNDNNAVIFKKMTTGELDDFFTKGGKLTAEIKNLSTSLPTASSGALLASYLEIARGKNTAKGEKRFTFVFGLDADKTPTIIGLNNGAGTSYIAPSDSLFKYKITGGANQYNTYEMVYDPATDTVDMFVNGVERISNFPGNTVDPGYAAQINGSAAAIFGSGSSAGTAKTNYGAVQLTLRNTACSAVVPPTPVVGQSGACCPAGAQWNSDENKCTFECLGDTEWDSVRNMCVPNGCAEGQYYCDAEKTCKPANQSCGTVTCNNNGICDLNESCNCADCNGQIDHCGMVGGQQLYCAPDPAPQCYTDRFPYCFPICLDGYALNATGQCVVSGGTSLSASTAALASVQVGACCPAGAQWSIANNRCETNCNTTQAPSELKAGVDQPYISCTAGPAGTTHFKYRLTDTSAPTATPFTSEIYANGTPVLHPVINTAGSYKVECFYGNAASVDTGNTATPSTCVKNITVKNDPNTQGCEGIVSYKGTTLATTLEDTNVFTARFQCINRISENPLLSNPFRIQYATNNFINLGFATVIDPNLASSIGLNRLSAQDQYSFQPGTTSVTCAVKVGDGYSTNTSCQKNACVGSSCSTPQTFSVIHSDNLTCTTQATAEYKIGCNPNAPESNRTACVNWLTQMAGTNTSFKAPFIFNGTLYGDIACNKYGPNDPALGGVNMQANIVCRATLNNGQQYTILAADAGGSPVNSLQTTTYTVKKDSTNPDLLPLELYLNPTLTLQVTDFDRWYNVPLTLVARCNDKPGISDGDECACASETLSESVLWSPGVPHGQLGPDIMYYTRTISASTNNISVQVKDTAGNPSNISPQINLNIDTQAPTVAISETGSGASRTIQLSVTDTNSKIWTNSSIPTGGQNNGGIMYRTGPKTDAQNLMLDTDCGVSPVSLLPTVAQTATIPSNKVITIPNINTSNTVVTYCVKDNAGNVTRGSYPTVSNACFSASNMSTVPNFDTYKDALITRLNTNKYGYSFSENSADAQCFRGILANNVATLISNQLTPRTETDLDWGTSLAFVRNTNNRNTNGYYYYSYSTNNTLRISTSPSDSGTKTVVVDGGNIQITQDINYSGTGKLLVLIARKNNNGQGGNILIDPTVSNIDAIIIADGGALINTDTNALGERLTINGRIYSYNTRGGSLTVSGADLVDASSGKQFNNSTLVNSSQFSESRAQDLERFRTMSVDGNTQCSLHVNYQVLTNSQLPPILQRPTTFGGSCGF